MILKALYDYYHRNGKLPRQGMENKEIGYLIVIDENGTFLRIESRMIDKKRATQFLVAQTVQRSGRKFIGNYLWDNCEYVIGYSEKDPDKATLCKEAFTKRVKELRGKLPNNRIVNAVYKFYQNYPFIHDVLNIDPLWKEITTSKKNISFLIQGSTFIAAEDPSIVNFSIGHIIDADAHICLVTGQKGKTARIHAKIPLQGNAFTSLVSFKDGKGYDSYGKNQGANAPICENAEFAYTTALNHLLRSESRNKFMVGSRTFLFWASNNNEVSKKAEESFYLLSIFSNQEDDPDRNVGQAREVFESIYNGTLKTTSEDVFYILGLAPNSARIAVTYWAEIPLRRFAETICKHFYDMEVVDTRNEKKPYMSLRSMISTVTLGGKPSDATPNLADAVVKSIFEGLPYPQTLFASCIRRIRAESGEKDKNSVYITRAAIIKAYLNRLKNNQTKIKAMLDKENINQGYLCGRLFAILERIQEISNRDNDYFTNLRSNYMNSASTAPSTVFPTILNLSIHHSDKLDKKDMIQFERDKQGIIDKLKDFPNHLNLEDQGRFFIGYYHQRQNFFTKSEDNNKE